MVTAKIFMNGRSQAVRLPKNFRFFGNMVSIHREGEAVILEPVKLKKWPKSFFQRIRIMDPEFKQPEKLSLPLLKGW